eukprot:CAMPEP_0183710418 /NCGR_PEP_ID=MMETSP0737-20130205/6150_1 /TAXON_ID=385413 /ORGANISM="Thalassiosira miniscula, Strain CCMP1093" /LENGTH=701 /DNA_ID=CAMNT_0025938683 /DNA_START=169 /DNA_END=2274 /DNA_ORIENTATION=-
MLPSVVVIAVLMVNANAAAKSATDGHNQHRVLTNSETGTITHPLIPHKTHLDRRRRELHQKYGADSEQLDFTLPPRPHTSRHSQTPNHEAIVSSLRAKNKHNDERSLQQQMGALYQGYGTHYVDLWVGSPDPQRQTVIVDTGSGVTAFPCEECKGCGDSYHTDMYFKESKSKTFRPLECNECFRGYCATVGGAKRCRISMSYAEGSSWSAYEANDLCYAGGPHDVALTVNGPMTNSENDHTDHIDPVDASQFAFELAFGCQISITGLFITQLADGIMGMENEKTSFWKQMHLKNAIPRPEFSLCFSRSNEAARDGTGAGAMTLGGVDPRLHMSPMVFAKNVKGSGFYAVHLKSVYLREGGGVSAQTAQADMGRMHKLAIDENQLNRGNVIVDSGTTDSYFTSALAGPFKKKWKELTGKDYNHNPVSLTPEQIDALPTIVLVISGYDGENVGDEPNGDPNTIANYAGDTDLSANPRDIVVAIPAAHYMEYDPDNKKFVPRFYTEESSGSVLGANAMMGHDVYFDIERSRIGFAESNCDYVSLLMSEGTSISKAPNTVSTNAESAKTEAPPEGQNEPEVEENPPLDETSNEPGPDQSQNNENPYELFGNEKPMQGEGGGKLSWAEEILEDMKHECRSTGCRGVAGMFILVAVAMVVAGIRRTMARRRVAQQYQEAGLEITDLALSSDSDDEGYVDEPPMPQIT